MRTKIIRLLFIPTLLWNVFLGRWLSVRRWWNELPDESVILGALPFASDVEALHELGVTGVINMCVEYRGPIAQYDRVGIEQLWLPTVDFTPPTLESISQGVEFLDRHVSAGGKVYVHCKAGRGRSATVLLCWLMHRHQMTPEQGSAFLAEHRPHINKGLAERKVVKEFYHQLKQGA